MRGNACRGEEVKMRWEFVRYKDKRGKSGGTINQNGGEDWDNDEILRYSSGNPFNDRWKEEKEEEKR